ncbi:FYVE, RhoGEF and PH domain-containing protein 4-like isoform X3 [Ptychodera flava]|uniref:FYVE, RhoGEF and PH domain-containing protein 4-like isoform X3 n=1 Tax=Ptychodera flava TaxID=63121 RepID=UPI00396A9566
MSRARRIFRTFRAHEEDDTGIPGTKEAQIDSAEPSPFSRQTHLRVSLSEKVTYFNRKGQFVRQRTIVGSPCLLVKQAPSAPGVGKASMNSKDCEAENDTFSETSEDEEEDGRLNRRRSMSDPNLLAASLQVRNASGLFAGKGKPAVPKKPLSMAISPPLQRSKRWKAPKTDLWCDTKQIPELQDLDPKGSDNKKKNSGKKDKQSAAPKPEKDDEKTNKGKTKDNEKVKQKGNIFSRLRGKSDADVTTEGDTSKRKKEETKETTAEETNVNETNRTKDADIDKLYAKVKGRSRTKPATPPRPISPPPKPATPPRPISPPPKPKSTTSPKPSSVPPKPNVVPPTTPTSPKVKPKVPPPPVPRTPGSSSGEPENDSKPEPLPKRKDKPVIYEEVFEGEDKDMQKESGATEVAKTQKPKRNYEEVYSDDAKSNSSEDIPIADPEDFVDDFSSSEGDDEKPVLAENRIKIQPIVLPIEVEDEEMEFIDEAHKVAHELLITEKKYVNRLFLVDQVFHFRLDIENRARNWFNQETVKEMFANIKSIYQFHRDFLLPKLEERLENWKSNPKIGDLMKSLAPFFKLYSDYVKNFDHAMELLNSWMVKQPDFADLVRAIQMDPACGNLSLPHHMLEPVQRIPRYELLLKEYLKSLPADAEDRSDTQGALDLISTATLSSMEAMKKIETFKSLLELLSNIEGSKDIIVPGRELLKEGKIIKRSARRGEAQYRYLFLFNDILLCCSIHKKLVTTGKYKVRAKLDVEGMKVVNVSNEKGTFRVSSRQKVMEFQASSDEQRIEWVDAINDTITELQKKQENFVMPDENNRDILGKRAPKWVRDDFTSQCQRCAAEFHPIKRRRHHCRACGLVVCDKCSSNRVRMEYDDRQKLHRVCKECYRLLELQGQGLQRSKSEDNIFTKTETENQKETTDTETRITKSEDEADAEDDDEEEEIDYSNFLHQQTTDKLHVGKKIWSRRWLVISNQALHFYKAQQDINPFLSLPLSCYKALELTEDDGIERQHCFKVTFKKTLYYLSADSQELKFEWMEMIKKYSKPSGS